MVATLVPMSGRYAFSLPEPRDRDGWFKLGKIDVSTTALIVGLGLCSMVLFAISPSASEKLAFSTMSVRDGEVWRILTWPVLNPPISIWALVSLLVFWWLGHLIEDQIGRVPYTWLVVAMTVIPAVLVTLLNFENDLYPGRWSAYTFSVSLLSLGMLTIFGLDRPDARFFFGIPAWVIAAAFIFIEVLQDLGNRAWATLIMDLLVVIVGCIGARQRGMLDHLEFIPRWRKLAGNPSPYGHIGSAAPKAKRTKGRKAKQKGGGGVVAGPWPQPGGISPLEQAELDVLLDRIGEGGIDSLSPHEKARLTELSKRMRES